MSEHWWTRPEGRCPICSGALSDIDYRSRLQTLARELARRIKPPAFLRPPPGMVRARYAKLDGWRDVTAKGGDGTPKSAMAIFLDVVGYGMIQLADHGHPPDVVASLRAELRIPIKDRP